MMDVAWKLIMETEIWS